MYLLIKYGKEELKATKAYMLHEAAFASWPFLSDMNAMIKNVTLKISNLGCEQCQRAISNTIKALPGITSISVEKGQPHAAFSVTYESGKVSFEKIRNAVVELGYTVDGYIIHEHVHAHGNKIHKHPHTHRNKDEAHNNPEDHLNKLETK